MSIAVVLISPCLTVVRSISSSVGSPSNSIIAKASRIAALECTDGLVRWPVNLSHLRTTGVRGSSAHSEWWVGRGVFLGQTLDIHGRKVSQPPRIWAVVWAGQGGWLCHRHCVIRPCLCTSLDLLPLPSAFGRALAPTAECRRTEAFLHPQATNQPTFQPAPRRQQQQLPLAPHHQQPQANWHHPLISMATDPPSPPPTHPSHLTMGTQRWLAHQRPAKRGQQTSCPQLPNALPPPNHSQTLRRNS